jgi:hypothetical protein
VVVTVIALLPVFVVCRGILDDFGFTITSLGRCGLFVLVFAGLVLATRATFAPGAGVAASDDGRWR